MYKMYLISAEGLRMQILSFWQFKTTIKIWVSMKDVRSGMGIKDM